MPSTSTISKKIAGLLKKRIGNTLLFAILEIVISRLAIFFKKNIRINGFNVIPISDFAVLQAGDRIIKKIEAQPVNLLRLPYWNNNGIYTPAMEKQVMSRPVFFMALHNCEITGGNSIITRGKVAMFDEFFWPNASRNNFYFGYFWDIFAVTKTKIYLQHPANAVVNTIDTGIYMGGSAAFNYYHWILEFLCKLYIIENAGIDARIPILADAVIKDSPQLLEVLTCVSERQVIFIPGKQKVLVKKIYWSNSFLWLVQSLKWGIQYKAEDCVIAPEPVIFIREKVLQKLSPVLKNSAPTRLIFISKRVVNYRRYNEQEVLSVLSPLGFETVYPEDLSFYEQVSLFRDSVFIVGATGAWLTNTLFATSMLNVLYFTGLREETFFAPFGTASGARMEKFIIDAEDESYVHSDFSVNIHRFEKVVNDILDTINTAKR